MVGSGFPTDKLVVVIILSHNQAAISKCHDQTYSIKVNCISSSHLFIFVTKYLRYLREIGTFEQKRDLDICAWRYSRITSWYITNCKTCLESFKPLVCDSIIVPRGHNDVLGINYLLFVFAAAVAKVNALVIREYLLF